MSDAEPVKTFLNATREGDLKTALSVIGPDIVVSEPAGLPYGGRYEGFEAFLSLMEAISQSYTIEVSDFRTIDGGDVAVVIIDSRWTSVSTGRSLEARACELYRTAGGMITGIEVFPQDTHGLHELTLPEE